MTVPPVTAVAAFAQSAAQPSAAPSPPAHQPAERPAPRRKIKEMEVMVADVVVETPDTATLVFFTGNDRLEYEPGHFLTIDPHQFEALERFTAFFEDEKGKREPPRAYSMCSTPDEKYLAVTVKEERYQSGVTKYPPLMSPMLVKRTSRGMRMQIVGFTGPYVLPVDVESKTDHLVHVVAGSGVVPNFAILKHALRHHPKLVHTFVYSNKTWEDVIFRDALAKLQAEHPDKLRVVHTLTRDPDAASRGDRVRTGRVSAALLREEIPDPSACLVYACGPAISVFDRQLAKKQGTAPQPRFLEAAVAALGEVGVPKERIKTESYG
jgi:3-ketosteroid 9alpha-monooxygenase subunit B